jgi:hypothetical protein
MDHISFQNPTDTGSKKIARCGPNLVAAQRTVTLDFAMDTLYLVGLLADCASEGRNDTITFFPWARTRSSSPNATGSAASGRSG